MDITCHVRHIHCLVFDIGVIALGMESCIGITQDFTKEGLDGLCRGVGRKFKVKRPSYKINSVLHIMTSYNLLALPTSGGTAQHSLHE